MDANPADTAVFDGISDRELLRIWSSTMVELRRRGILRSDNSPTGDYAEWVISKAMNVELEKNSQSGFDAIDSNKKRYQIKARRLVSSKTSRQLGAIRNLMDDPFDFLIVVIFGSEFQVLECWSIPIEVAREYAVFTPHVNAHRLFARGPILTDIRTVRLTLVEQMFGEENS